MFIRKVSVFLHATFHTQDRCSTFQQNFYLLIMKNVLLFLTAILILSCSSDNSDEEDLFVEVNLSPPEWIIGTWLDESNFGWKFSQNNAIWIIQGQEDRNIKMLLERELNNWDFLTAKSDVLRENKSDTNYDITEILYSTPSEPSEFTYRFLKISDTEIRWVNGPGFQEYNLTKQN